MPRKWTDTGVFIAFANQDDHGEAGSRSAELWAFLESSPDSPLRRYSPAGGDIDSVIDLRAVFPQAYRDLAMKPCRRSCS